MSDQPQGATLTAVHAETAQQTWERIMADYHARYPEVQRILDIHAEAERVYRETLLAMQPVKVWLTDHANSDQEV
jgi:hypothetical protein